MAPISGLPRVDLARYTLGVTSIGGLMVASFWIILPFLAAMIWAAMVVVATWPLLLGLQRRLGGRRGPAVAVMTAAILLLLILPITLGVLTLADNASQVVSWVQSLAREPLPQLPAWATGLPVVGQGLATGWEQLQGAAVTDLLRMAAPYLQEVARWVVAEVGAVGWLLLQFLLVVALSAVLYSGGEAWAGWLRQLGHRLAETRGEQAVILAGQAIRGVALGVVVTALVQSVLGAIGLAVAGVPLVGVLFALMFVLCIAQLGPLLVLLGATGWLFWSGSSGWGSFLLVWSLVVGLMDNFLRPLLIRRGADLPLLLIIAGVVGGLLAFGLIGIFVGPVVLAVSYTLLDAWIRQDQRNNGDSYPDSVEE